MDPIYLHLSSNDSLSSYPNNNCWDFTVDLKTCLILPGKWECALTEIDFTNDNLTLIVFCDLCSQSFVMDNYLPVLRVVTHSQIFEKPYFVKISRQNITHLRVYIRTYNGEKPSFHSNTLRCTLLLRPA